MALKRSPSVSILNVPFWISVKLLTMANPKPLPASCLDLSPRTNRSVMSSLNSNGVLDVFFKVIWTLSVNSSTFKKTLVFSKLYLEILVNKFSK